MSKKVKQAILKITVSVLLLGFLLWKVDRESLVHNFGLLSVKYIPLIILFLVLNYIISSVRWKMLLIYENSEDVTVPYLTSLYFIGSFFNNFMPTSIGGDVYKIFKLGQKLKSNSNAFSATFMERFTGMIALVLISYVGLIRTMGFWVALLPKSISESAVYLPAFKILLFVGFWLMAFAGFASLKFLSKKIEIVNKVYSSLTMYRGRNTVMVNAFLTSFIVQFLAIFTQFFVFKSLGVNLPLWYSLFVFPVITLASFLIPSLNGIGVQDALYIQLFSVVGVQHPMALSASIVYHLFRLSVSLIGGVLYAFGKADK